jgi:hypothetical protein
LWGRATRSTTDQDSLPPGGGSANREALIEDAYSLDDLPLKNFWQSHLNKLKIVVIDAVFYAFQKLM